MPSKRHKAEQVISQTQEAEVLLSQGQTAGDIRRSFAISEQTYYRWRKEYGRLPTDQAFRLN